jgi:vacuolar-type H+-ATPase subunit F/Vma7
MEWVQPTLAKHRKEYPLVVSIPTKKGPKTSTDTLAQLVKRTVGIELKVKK